MQNKQSKNFEKMTKACCSAIGQNVPQACSEMYSGYYRRLYHRGRSFHMLMACESVDVLKVFVLPKMHVKQRQLYSLRDATFRL